MTGAAPSKLPKANAIVAYEEVLYRMQPVLFKGFGPGMCNGCAFSNSSPDCMTSPPCVSDLGANLIFTPVVPALA